MRTGPELEQRTLALHQQVAIKLRNDPALFHKALNTIQRWEKLVHGSSQPYIREWSAILALGIEPSLQVALENSQRGDALRQNCRLAS